MSCKICYREVNIQIPLNVHNDLIIDGELEIQDFCYRCMYVISKAYNNLLRGNVNNLQAFNLVQEILDGEI